MSLDKPNTLQLILMRVSSSKQKGDGWNLEQISSLTECIKTIHMFNFDTGKIKQAANPQPVSRKKSIISA